MSIVREFREFAVKGNVVDLAVGVIIGAAFGKIVTSLVNDVIMPPIGLMLGSVDFSNLFLNLHGSYGTVKEAEAAGAPIIKYGIFINNIIDFLIVAFVIFLMVRAIQPLVSHFQEIKLRHNAISALNIRRVARESG